MKLRRWFTTLGVATALAASVLTVTPTAHADPTVVPQLGQVPVPVDQTRTIDNMTVLMATAAERTSTTKVYNWDIRRNFYLEKFDTAADYLSWKINVPQGDVYRIAAQQNAQAGQTFKLTVKNTGGEKTFTQTNGGWQRTDAGTITLPSGESTLELRRTSLTGTAEVKSLELIRESENAARNARITATRSDTTAFSQSGYGLMFQYGSWGTPDNAGPAKPLNRQAADFDVPAFVKMVKETGAGYVIWSYSWWGYRVDGPNGALDSIMGNGDFTADRDLIGEVATALKAQGLGFYLYVHEGSEEAAYWAKQNFPADYSTGVGDRSTFMNNWKRVIGDVGARYGTKLDGFFFDDAVAYYPAAFEEMRQVARTGNPNRTVSWNSWYPTRTTEFSDVYFGEGSFGGAGAGSSPVGGDGKFTSGPQQGLLQHGMFPMESDWGVHLQGQKINIPADAPSTKDYVDRTLSAKSRNVPLTYTMMMYEDGRVHERSLAVLNDVRQAVRGTVTPLTTPVANQEDPAWSTSGTWSRATIRGAGDFGDDVKWTATNGDSATFTFAGTGADIIGPRSPASGKYDVYVDGVLVQRLSQYATSYKAQEVLYAARHLTPGQHTVRLVKVDGGYLQFDGTRVLGSPTTVNDSTFTYAGNWGVAGNRANDFGNDVHWTLDNGASATVTFTGTGIDVLMPMENGYGSGTVTLDGVPVGTVSADSKLGSYAAQQKVYTARHLTPGTHTLKLTKTGGGYFQPDAAVIIP